MNPSTEPVAAEEPAPSGTRDPMPRSDAIRWLIAAALLASPILVPVLFLMMVSANPGC